MNARETKKKLTIIADSDNISVDKDDANISISVTTTCAHVAEELRLLEAANAAYWMKALPRIVPEDRKNVMQQFLSRVRVLIEGCINNVQELPGTENAVAANSEAQE